MKKFWEILNFIFDWTMNILFAIILIGGSAYVILSLI